MIAKYVNEKRKIGMSIYLPFEVMFGRKAILPVEISSYDEEGENLLNNYENAHTQQDRVSKYM